MKIICVIILIFLNSVGYCQQGVIGTAAPKNAPTSFAELEAMIPKLAYRRFDGNPVIPYDPGTWKARQVHFPVVIENPNEPDSLIMFYGGGSILAGVTYSIGRADASKANPYKWADHASNPLFSPEDFSVGTIVGVDDAWWNEDEDRFELTCCTYSVGLGTSWLGLYYSDDGITFTYEGPLLEPDGDETFLGNGGILRDGATWYLAYTYRTASATLPGIRIASSTDEGATWTKHGDFVTRGVVGYDALYIEGVQFLKIGSDYILNYGCATNPGVVTFSAAFASSTSPLGTYTKSSVNPYFQKSTSGWDDTQVSTVVIYKVVDPWLVFYQGTDTPGDYGFALWSMGIVTLY